MTYSKEKMIPLAAVDVLIAELEHDYEIWNKQAAEEAQNGFYISSGRMAKEAECLEKQIENLRGLKKKQAISIPVPLSPTESSSLICPFCPYTPENKDFPTEWLSNHIYEVHKIKIEYAMIIARLIPEGNKPLEQRIQELEWCLNDLEVWGCNNIGEIKYKLKNTIKELKEIKK